MTSPPWHYSRRCFDGYGRMVNAAVQEVKEVDGEVVCDNHRKRSSEAPLSGSLVWERVKSERVEPEKVKNQFGFLFREGVYFILFLFTVACIFGFYFSG